MTTPRGNTLPRGFCPARVALLPTRCICPRASLVDLRLPAPHPGRISCTLMTPACAQCSAIAWIGPPCQHSPHAAAELVQLLRLYHSCIYIYIYIYKSLSIYICIHICIHMYIYIYIHTQMYSSTAGLETIQLHSQAIGLVIVRRCPARYYCYYYHNKVVTGNS